MRRIDENMSNFQSLCPAKKMWDMIRSIQEKHLAPGLAETLRATECHRT
jgi:hypothetical protein